MDRLAACGASGVPFASVVNQRSATNSVPEEKRCRSPEIRRRMELEWTRNTIVWRNARSTPPPMQKKRRDSQLYRPHGRYTVQRWSVSICMRFFRNIRIFPPPTNASQSAHYQTLSRCMPLAAAIFQQRVTRFLIRRCFIVVLLVKGAQCKT